MSTVAQKMMPLVHARRPLPVWWAAKIESANVRTIRTQRPMTTLVRAREIRRGGLLSSLGETRSSSARSPWSIGLFDLRARGRLFSEHNQYV